MGRIMKTFRRLQNSIQSWGSTSSSSVNSALPRLEQVNDSVYEVCKPHGSPSIEILFFHGLNFDGSEEVYLRTWLSADGSQLWPEWILQIIPQARVLLISHDASIRTTNQAGLMDIYVTCENLVQDLTGAQVGKEGCPVILVGHSVGCLVMKELCTALDGTLNKVLPENRNESVQHLFNNIKGLFYYACPHQGSELAHSSTEFVKGPLLRNLTVLNEGAARRNEDFRKLRTKYKWKSYGVGEGRATTYGNFTGFFVPEGSARYDVDDFYTADVDHFNVCRPQSTTSSTYLCLKKFITSVLTKDKDKQRYKIHYPDGVVGLERRVKAVIEMLEGAQRLGIVGMGGIGKTTLAKALYDCIERSYEYTCFVSDVKKFMTSNDDPHCLREKIQERLYHKGRQIDGSFSWNMLNGKTVLIVLDDVEYRSQIQVMLASDGFSDQSHVIVTSRDSGLLERENFTCYTVESLDVVESEKLFCLNAFKREDVLDDYKHLVMNFVEKCGGLPLALRVMGTSLKDEEEEEVWDEMLQKLKSAQSSTGNKEDELWSVLRLSYDSLEETEQQMFLDIAICFHGEDLEIVKGAWKVCSWASASYNVGWKNLVAKCLVTIEQQKTLGGEFSCIRMHEVLRALGRKIAGHSRVCFDESNRLPSTSPFDEGMMKVIAEVKVLKIVGSEFFWFLDTLISIQKLHILKELEVLWLYGVNLHGPCHLLPLKLVYLRISGRRWTYFDSAWFNTGRGRFLWRVLRPFFEHSRPLSTLRHLEVKELVFSQGVFVTLGRLQALEHLEIEVYSEDLSQALPLETLPNTFWQLQRLGKFILHDRINHVYPGAIEQLDFLQSLTNMGLLEGVGQVDLPVFHEDSIEITSYDSKFLPNSLGRLGRPKSLTLNECENLRALPDTLGDLQTLERFYLQACESLERLPDTLGKLQALEDLAISDCDGLTILPDTVGELRVLQRFFITRCNGVTSLPHTLGSLRSLKRFYLESCNSLEKLPDSFGSLSVLDDFRIEDCKSLVALPDTLGDAQALETVCVRSCESLKSLPDSLGRLQALKDFRIEHCKGLTALPDTLGNLQSLERFHLESCESVESLPNSLGQLLALEDLTIVHCRSLSGLPDSLGALQSLRSLTIGNCESLKSIPGTIGNLRALEYMLIFSCHDLNALPNTLGNLEALEALRIFGCPSLEVLPDTLGQLRALRVFEIEHCNGLRALPDTLGELQALHIFHISGCSGLKALPETLGDVQSLRVFIIASCENLKTLPGTLGNLQALQCLDVHDCQCLEALPNTFARKVQGWRVFIITSCQQLESRPEAGANLQAQDDLQKRIIRETTATRRWGKDGGKGLGILQRVLPGREVFASSAPTEDSWFTTVQNMFMQSFEISGSSGAPVWQFFLLLLVCIGLSESLKLIIATV